MILILQKLAERIRARTVTGECSFPETTFMYETQNNLAIVLSLSACDEHYQLSF